MMFAVIGIPIKKILVFILMLSTVVPMLVSWLCLFFLSYPQIVPQRSTKPALGSA
jgi:hypothetical protein